MIVLNPNEMQEFDRFTLESLKINETDLMQKAGSALTKDFLSRAKPSKKACLSIFAGIGNNGGDALVMAIELKKVGFNPNVFVVGNILKASEAFKYFLDLTKEIKTIDHIEALQLMQTTISKSDYIIDGIFGNGLTREVSGFRKTLFDYINQSKTIVYSIDFPSGISPINGKVLGKAIKANYTGVVGFYKLGNLLNDAIDYHGDIKLLDIDIVQKKSINKVYIDLEKYNIKKIKRLHNSNKYTYGLTVFIGGRASMTGSIQMSAISGLKSGIGLAVVISDIKKGFTQFYPELIVVDKGSESVLSYIKKADTIVFGPGLELNDEFYKTIIQEAINCNKKIVVDASGLTYLDYENPSNNPNILLTPHVGELAKIFHKKSEEIINDPLFYINKLTKLNYNVLLKGPCTIVSNGDKTIFMQAKNPGLATAGSGDVLSGIIGANLVSNSPLKAMELAVAIHSKASNLAKEKYGETSLIASNIIEFLHEALR